MHVCSSRSEERAACYGWWATGPRRASYSGCRAARRLRYRGQENKAHEMKARVRPSGIATTRAIPAPPPVHATRSAAAGPIAATNRTPGGDGLALHHSLSKRCRSPRRLRDKGGRRCSRK